MVGGDGGSGGCSGGGSGGGVGGRFCPVNVCGD